MEKYKKYIGKRFSVKGFNEARTVKIEDVYLLGGNSKYPSFKCSIVGNCSHFKNGERENFLCKNVISRDGFLAFQIRVLTA